MYGGDRDFYLTRRMFFGDSRPDSTGYNHGYTGDVNRYLIAELQKTHITLSFLTEFFVRKKQDARVFQCLQRPQGI
jgi:hypothetical protein